MRRLNVPGLVRLAGALLLCSALVAGTSREGAPAAAGQGRVKVECEGKAKDCKWPVRYMGEKDKCACFACDYGKKTQRVICTADEQGKNVLRKLVLAKRSPRPGTY